MARRRSSYRRGSAPRRRMFWARAHNLATLSETNTAQVINLLSPYQASANTDVEGVTVTRIRGHYTWWSGAQATNTSFNLGTGIIVQDQSVAAQLDTDPEQNATSPWDADGQYRDWMYVRNNLGITEPATGENQSAAVAANRVELDLKSQRRFDEVNQSLYAYVGLNEFPGENVFFWYDLHVLLKRP